MMLKELMAWPQKLREGSLLALDFYTDYTPRLPKHVKKIAFVGMGASGIAGRILKTFLDKKEGISTIIIDSSEVPAAVDADTLAVVISYSGNTWEILEALSTLAQKFVPTIVLAHGGKAIEFAETKNIPFALMPESLQPRSALGSFLGFLLSLFDKMGLLEGSRKLETFVRHAEIYTQKFMDGHYFDDFVTLTKSLDFFHVWGLSASSAAFAYRAQTQFNENSKVQCVFSSFPELNHNLINGFEVCRSQPVVVLFYTDFLSAKVNAALEATMESVKEYGGLLYKSPILGDTFEAQLFNIILWSDFASYYLGKARGIDIASVKIIEQLKQKQRQKGITRGSEYEKRYSSANI